jgi:excisionase family DNA binding protein
MKNPTSALYYPVVIKRAMNLMTISVPDLNITIIENLPNSNKLDKSYVTQIGQRVVDAWMKTQAEMKKKEAIQKPMPEASLVKHALKMAEKALTPTKFAKYVGVSYRTIIRDCEKGFIQAERTSGGHYKIPHSEISIYKEYLKNHTKWVKEPWCKEAMAKLRTE